MLQSLINWIDVFTADAPLILQFMLFGCIFGIIFLLIEMVIISIVWVIEDIKDKPEREKRRAEIDRLIAEVEKSKQDKKDYPAIELILYENLKKYASDRFIPLRFGERWFVGNEDAAGLCKYIIDRKFEIGEFFSIYIKNPDEPEWYDRNLWVLAHELGHVESITKYKDKSEQGADYEARKLCCSLLTDKELDNEYFEISLHCHTMTKEEMEKFEHVNNLLEDIRK